MARYKETKWNKGW